MNPTQEALNLIRETEAQLRKLAADAVSQGLYEDAMQLTFWGKSLARLSSESDSQSTMEVSPSSLLGARGTGKESASTSRGTAAISKSGKKARRTGKRRKSKKSSQYPRFFRSAKNLVKVAWSKSTKKEYSHRATRSLVDIVASVLSKLGASGDLLTAHDFMPILHPEDGSEIPSYQAYLCLAWFRAEGLVIQHGRQGYTVPDAALLRDGVAERWDALPRS